eukprot:322222-Amphidinium_carterae.1
MAKMLSGSIPVNLFELMKKPSSAFDSINNRFNPSPTCRKYRQHHKQRQHQRQQQQQEQEQRQQHILSH